MNNDLEQFTDLELEGMSHGNNPVANAYRELLAFRIAAKQANPVCFIGKQMLIDLAEENRSCGRVWLAERDEVDGNDRIPLYTTPQPAHTGQDGWIKCSDRMPPSSEPVWAYAQPGFEYAVEAYWDGNWYRTLTDEPEYSITHWMPLPAAPKPESE